MAINEALLEIQERWKVDLETCYGSTRRSEISEERLEMGGRRMKQIYWKCVDCQSMITDENMHEMNGEYAEFCYGCMNYNVDVVIAYA